MKVAATLRPSEFQWVSDLAVHVFQRRQEDEHVWGEPIICTPEDAYRCFMRTNMDVLVLENFILMKDDQAPVTDDGEWKKEFVLD
jgi:carbamoyltransferase-like protein